MTRKKRSVLLAVLTLVLCLALVAGGTYALFSDKVTLTNHLQAGTLDITLTRTNLVTKSLDDKTGFLVETTNPKDIDFSTPWDPDHPERENENVFDIVDGTLVVPGCKYTAEMQITNNTDVAFGYWLEIVFDDKVDLTLAKQLEITVTTVKGTTAGKLDVSAGLIGSEAKPIDVLAKTESALFTIAVEFCDLDDDINNTAKQKSFDFDVVVHAVQITTQPTP
ncbi:MAG: SipW-dependent-type signal peptide-containing protein [Clostridia bacterium]|nr:SipW-dependent-type signal peptide-containing protein [Clostridia bacterium]MBR7111928.1 SipW-dependent-type signal peptide-containing protein [Clostridia bacterium]